MRKIQCEEAPGDFIHLTPEQVRDLKTYEGFALDFAWGQVSPMETRDGVFIWSSDDKRSVVISPKKFREICGWLEEGNRKPHGVKARWTLLPWAGTEIVLQAMAHGAEKYGPDNWRGSIDRKEYLSAAARHLIAALMGEDIDPDSGLPHLAHVGANVAMILEEHGQ